MISLQTTDSYSHMVIGARSLTGTYQLVGFGAHLLYIRNNILGRLANAFRRSVQYIHPSN